MGSRGPAKGRPEMSLRRDPNRQATFLRVLAETGTIREAARQASPHSEHDCVTTFRNFMRDDASFASRVQEALDAFRESLVAEAVRRGRDGYARPIFQRGEKVGEETVYSDSLLLAELRKHYPQHYSEKHQHDHRVTIQPSGAWVIGAEDLSYLTAGERKTLAGLMDRVREGRGERRALEHQPGEVLEGDFTEVDDAPEYWELAYVGTGDE